MKKTGLYSLAFGTMILTLGLTSCANKKGAEAAEKAETVFAVNVYKAVPRTLDDYLEFGGNVETASSVDIFPDVQSGKLSKINVRVGDKVKKDQVVALVDASKAGMDYQSSPIKAPVDGTITSFPYTVGTTVAASMSVGKISSTGQLEIKTNVAERFMSRVSKNQRASLTFDAYPGKTFPAKLVEIDPILDVNTRTLGIKLLQTPSDSRLRAGMYARIKLITDTKKNTIVIPTNVIVRRNEEDIVYIVDSLTNTVKASPVKRGIRVDDKQEVEMGITPGDLVVIKGQSLLSDGAKVNVVSIVE
ncbi:MAG: efflux RND transporter periplasmic adaptor subunit [Treponema sp.]|nr:efflux RND transporter periplasmic adaptor subunit [Treponema sp.]